MKMPYLTMYSKHQWLWIAISLVIVGCTQPSSSSPKETSTQTATNLINRPIWTLIRINQHELEVEVADQEETRSQGLMFRTQLAPNHGMLFIYPTPRPIAMWMKNTVVPLDVAFLNEQGLILNIATMEPLSLTNHGAYAPAVYGLEVNAGWFQQHGIHPGMKVDGLPDYRKAQF